MGFWKTIKNGAKLISGVQAYQNRKEAKSLKEEADLLKYEIELENEEMKEKVNFALQEFGRIRCTALQKTVGPFIQQLTLMKQKVKDKEYGIIDSIGLTEEYVSELESVEINASTALRTAGAAGSLASVALSGVPVVVTKTVGLLATASTGIEISSLSGAAATNATLAWLGGGSIASGGGGMALGSTVLAGATYTTAGVFALAASGIIAGSYFSKKLTEATQYHSEVSIWASNMKGAFALMDGVIMRCEELSHITIELQDRIVQQIEFLKPLAPCFDTNDEYFLTTFNNVRQLVKTMSEVCQVPILDNEGNASNESKLMITQVTNILNKDLAR